MPTLREIIVAHETTIADLRTRLASEEQALAELKSICPETEGRRTKGDVHTGRGVDLVRQILLDNGKSMHLKEIATVALQTGREIHSRNGFYGYVSQALSNRRDVFKRLGPGIWDLVERNEPT